MKLNSKFLKYLFNNLSRPIGYLINKFRLNKKMGIFLLLFFLFFNINSQTKSYKRGVAYGYHSENDMQRISQHISWWYNWAAEPDIAIRNTYKNYDLDYTPMAWNGNGINNVNNWVNQDSEIKYILGFNEPNFKDQANMTPLEAATKWLEFQEIATSNNLKTVGPAVNYCGNCVEENGTTYYNAFTYLDDFFDACKDCKVDYIALHWYGSGNSIVGYIEDARKYNKPIWITEVASWDASNPVQNVEEQKKYLAGTVNFLERDPDVYRYSWFIGRTNSGKNVYPFIDLYGADGELTELGELYMQIPVYDANYKFQIPGRIEAEEYYLMKGFFAEITEDTNGFLNLGWTDNDDWAEYKINVSETGIYNLSARVSGSNTGVIDFLIDGNSAIILNTPNTGGWQSWQTISTEIELTEGEHILKMFVKDAGFNINWIDISKFDNPTTLDSFTVKSKSQTCPEKNNGELLITASEIGSYLVTIKSTTFNKSYNFTDTKLVSELGAGVYSICIKRLGESEEQCYNVTIESPNMVSGKASVNASKVSIEINKGTIPYTVFVNEIEVLKTTTSIFDINVKHGDIIQVKTAIGCEGVFSKTIDLFNEITAYPNPTSGNFEISFPIEYKQVKVTLFTVQSQLISSKIYPVINGKIQISLERKPSGIYFLEIGEGNYKNIKIIKT